MSGLKDTLLFLSLTFVGASEGSTTPTTAQCATGASSQIGYASHSVQCVALYDFPGSNPGELACSANETLLLVSNDGSGWVLCGKVHPRHAVVSDQLIP